MGDFGSSGEKKKPVELDEPQAKSTSELARLCKREAIRDKLKEKRAEVLAAAAEAGKTIRYPRREFRIRSEHLKYLLPVLINTLTRLFTRYLSECKVPKQWESSETALSYNKGDPYDIANYRPICLLSIIYKLFTKVILNRIAKVLDEGQP
ncbi:hypothetical protein RB195_004045 [Necator americanus]|uniref:Reverse transcriptase domain-containing protein n=1 Tax=Necator americanus TaxID=51031 RepID=A0ABR1BG15_NECAM